MAVAKVLSGYSGIGHQTSAGVFRDTSPVVTAGGSISMSQSATTSHGGDPQGVEFFVGVRLADQTIAANRNHVEYMIASYDLTGGVYTWNRVATIDSSNGGAAIDWDAIDSNDNSLRFYAITPNNAFLTEDDINGEDWREVGSTGNPSFENSWVNYNSGFETAAFRKIGNRVDIKGLVQSGVTLNTVFTLPEGYRPNLIRMFSSHGAAGSIRLDVYPGGAVLLNTGASSVFSSLECSFYI